MSHASMFRILSLESSRHLGVGLGLILSSSTVRLGRLNQMAWWSSIIVVVDVGEVARLHIGRPGFSMKQDVAALVEDGCRHSLRT